MNRADPKRLARSIATLALIQGLALGIAACGSHPADPGPAPAVTVAEPPMPTQGPCGADHRDAAVAVAIRVAQAKHGSAIDVRRPLAAFTSFVWHGHGQGEAGDARPPTDAVGGAGAAAGYVMGWMVTFPMRRDGEPPSQPSTDPAGNDREAFAEVDPDAMVRDHHPPDTAMPVDPDAPKPVAPEPEQRWPATAPGAPRGVPIPARLPEEGGLPSGYTLTQADSILPPGQADPGSAAATPAPETPQPTASIVVYVAVDGTVAAVQERR